MDQKHMFYRAHREVNDTLQDAAWLAGLLGDNPNPMTREEVAAAAGKPYSWAFQMIQSCTKS